MATSIREQPFTYHRGSKCGVNDPQITFEELQAELQNLKDLNLVMFIRTYVQERTPAAFSDEPMLWEAVREWFAARLGVHPREIGLSGSAQSGFSMKSTKLGVPFDRTSSDLDLFVVSESCYAQIEKEARMFVARYADGEKFKAQVQTVGNQMRRGHVDLKHIPAVHDTYPLISKAKDDVSIIISRLKRHNFSLNASHLRVYKGWSDLGRWVLQSYSI